MSGGRPGQLPERVRAVRSFLAVTMFLAALVLLVFALVPRLVSAGTWLTAPVAPSTHCAAGAPDGAGGGRPAGEIVRGRVSGGGL